MKNKIIVSLISILVLALAAGTIQLFTNSQPHFETATVTVKPIATEISAPGTIHSENEATLHFQTGGKVVSLPYKVGDVVYQGATIAQLDTYSLQRQLSAALNSYRSTRDTFDQQQTNAQNGNLAGQQKFTLDATTTSRVDGTDVINDTVKRILDQQQATLDNSVINVELANYALQLSSLTSPINGVITAEDITTPFVNITPLTSFSVADPTTPIFKAHVAETDIDYVTVGANVHIILSGLIRQLDGTVTQIEPQKITDATGNYYIVDIASPTFKQYGKLGQGGHVLIENTLSGEHLLIPAWTILDHNNVWVLQDNKPQLRKVITGKVHGTSIEILDGLHLGDKIISNPQSIAKLKYTVL